MPKDNLKRQSVTERLGKFLPEGKKLDLDSVQRAVESQMFTPSQREVVAHLLRGERQIQVIADRMELSEGRVRDQIRTVAFKLSKRSDVTK